MLLSNLSRWTLQATHTSHRATVANPSCAAAKQLHDCNDSEVETFQRALHFSGGKWAAVRASEHNNDELRDGTLRNLEHYCRLALQTGGCTCGQQGDRPNDADTGRLRVPAAGEQDVTRRSAGDLGVAESSQHWPPTKSKSDKGDQLIYVSGRLFRDADFQGRCRASRRSWRS